MNRLSQHVRANAVAYLALFVALGGTGYAAINLPAGSVGSRQIKNHSITPIKFDPTKIGASVRYWAIIQGGRRVLASHPRGARLFSTDPTHASGLVTWNGPQPADCFSLATGNGAFVQALMPPSIKASASVQFYTFDASGHPAPGQLNIAVLCPQP
jgi:hypothetical protein